jgi:hypothetical protein
MFKLNVYVIDSVNNKDNIFLNKNINKLLVDIFKSEYRVEYVNNFEEHNVILFGESVELIKYFIDKHNINFKKCVAITQEVYHETTENTCEEYGTNNIYIYNCFNNKFYLNPFSTFYGVPNGKIDISNKTKDNYSCELYYFGNIWRQNWYNKCSLYRKRTEIAVYGYKNKLISKIFSRDFYGIPLDNVKNEDMELEKTISEIAPFSIKNISLEEKRTITKNLFFSIEFLPTDYTNFVSERPFDAIMSGCVPIFMGTNTLKHFFPVDSIIYIDEFSTPYECLKYVKEMKYDDWKIRIDKCIDIILKLAPEGNTGDNLIFKIFKNIVDELFPFKKNFYTDNILKKNNDLFFIPPKNGNHNFLFNCLSKDQIDYLFKFERQKVLCDNCCKIFFLKDTRKLLLDNKYEMDCINCGAIQEINTKTLLQEKNLLKLETIVNYKEKLSLFFDLNNLNSNDVLYIHLRNIYERSVSIYLHICKFGYILNEKTKISNFSFEEWLELLFQSRNNKVIFDHHYDNQSKFLEYIYILDCKFDYKIIDNKKQYITDNNNEQNLLKDIYNIKFDTEIYFYCGNIRFLNLKYENYDSFYNKYTKKMVEQIYEMDFRIFENFKEIVDFPYKINLD